MRGACVRQTVPPHPSPASTLRIPPHRTPVVAGCQQARQAPRRLPARCPRKLHAERLATAEASGAELLAARAQEGLLSKVGVETGVVGDWRASGASRQAATCTLRANYSAACSVSLKIDSQHALTVCRGGSSSAGSRQYEWNLQSQVSQGSRRAKSSSAGMMETCAGRVEGWGATAGAHGRVAPVRQK